MSTLFILIAGLIFAYIGYRKTWYPSWAYFFNLLIAVYVSIMLTPQIVDATVLVRTYLGNYSYAVFALMTAAVVFTGLELLSFRYFTSASSVTFPKILDGLGAAVLGFLTGSLIAGFLLYLITITPLLKYSFVKSAAGGGQPNSCGNYAVIISCSFVHDISLQPIPDAVEKQLECIMNKWDRSAEEAKNADGPPDNNTIDQAPRTAGDD